MNTPIKSVPTSAPIRNNTLKNKTQIPKKRTPPMMLQVHDTLTLSEDMKRIILVGSALEHFPHYRNGAHIKVFLPQKDQSKPVLPSVTDSGIVWPEASQRPITRTYSVRRYDPSSNQLWIDFVLHGDDCPASGWASNAKPGDYLGVSVPGGPFPLIAPATHHIIAGDLTALPAISALLEDLPRESQGHAIIHSPNEGAQIPIVNHTKIKVQWVCSHNRLQASVLLNAIKQLPTYHNESVSAFIAGENSSVITLRNHLRELYKLPKSKLYAVPYWRLGQDEETYHQERHSIMDEEF